MISCPYCDAENIPGADHCEDCGQPLNDMHLAPPSNEVERSLLKDRINVLQLKHPCIVGPDQPVGEVLQTMAKHRIGCVMVLDDDQLLGIFTERDALLKLNTDAARRSQEPISNFMTPNPQTLQDTAKIAFAVQRMDLGGYRHIPIVSAENELQGIISVRHILDYLSARMGN